MRKALKRVVRRVAAAKINKKGFKCINHDRAEKGGKGKSGDVLGKRGLEDEEMQEVADTKKKARGAGVSELQWSELHLSAGPADRSCNAQ
jgi:hypothetical protein